MFTRCKDLDRPLFFIQHILSYFLFCIIEFHNSQHYYNNCAYKDDARSMYMEAQ